MAENTMINTTFPVLIPEMKELHLSKSEFESYIFTLLHPTGVAKSIPIRHIVEESGTGNSKEATKKDGTSKPAVKAPFMEALFNRYATSLNTPLEANQMSTENGDVAFATSGQALVDLFYNLQDSIDADRLRETLEQAWKDDADATLKIIWNARSIHLGKSSRNTFYRAVGRLAKEHPVTLLENLPWLVRPLIQKEAPKAKEEKKEDTKPEDAELVDAEDADGDFEIIDEKDSEPERKRRKIEEDEALSAFDVKYGVAHGYWKDLLNILALAANDQLRVDGEPRKVFNVDKPKSKMKRDWTAGQKKNRVEAHLVTVNEKLNKDPFYKALHLTVARLFAEQLKTDLARLTSGTKSDARRITFAAKWAPSHKGMHDQNTCIVSSIAEVLYPLEKVCPTADPTDRARYLKHARQAYQTQTLSPLRKALDVVERAITSKAFTDIKYDRLPSLAMKQYTPLFVRKDKDRFVEYLEAVSGETSRISGATLLPSVMIAEVLGRGQGSNTRKRSHNHAAEKALQEIERKALDGQWNALVQRIRDSGTLESSIAVCDVSGSMTYPRFPDGTTPMDAAIGLSLLMAEIVKPPFGGAFITFSAVPQVMNLNEEKVGSTLHDKASYIERSNWDGNTDFVAVFERLILPMAIKHGLKQEDMVRKIFVFSDMQFDSARGGGADGDLGWNSSYTRIEKLYEVAGYEMPTLIFWNLAGERLVRSPNPKPVEATKKGTVLVSGYSQGQLKMFLENGQFDDPVEEKTVEETEDGDAVVVEKKVTKTQPTPVEMMRKAISHEAYRMLRVVD